MLNFLDRFLDSTSMYRLVLYVLIGYIVYAIALSFFGVLSYSPWSMILSSLLLVAICWTANKIFAYLFSAPSNVESTYITGLILALIISPAKNMQDFLFLGIAGFFAVSSKYILALHKKHVFNPAAIAVVLTGFLLHRYASWWVGTEAMFPIILLGGFLVLKKLQKIQLISLFLIGVAVITCVFGFFHATGIIDSVQSLFFDSAIVFFATIMLTEPLTSPPTKLLQVIYGGIVVLLIDPRVHIGFFYSTPELCLVIVNIFAFIVSPKKKLLLHVKEKIQIGVDQVEFIFQTQQKISFSAGQYMEWTLQHKNTDSRGNRRYFTIASSPTEESMRLGVKFYENGSSYKRALHHISAKDTIVGGQLAGDFTLPKDTKRKLVFIAGGIGITPFRSMVKYLIDTKQKRDIVLFYSNKITSEIMYEDVFKKAETIGVRCVYTLTDIDTIPRGWKEEKGRISPEMLKKYLPDFKERLFYLSGPHNMVIHFEEALKELGISPFHIKKDFFPGFV